MLRCVFCAQRIWRSYCAVSEFLSLVAVKLRQEAADVAYVVLERQRADASLYMMTRLVLLVSAVLQLKLRQEADDVVT